jgi:hypothetical protein
MTRIEMSSEGFVVDAELIAEAFRIEPDEVRRRMQSGDITSRCEKGMDEDEGRWRLVFHHDGRALRLTVDGSGQVLGRVTFAAPRGAAKPNT